MMIYGSMQAALSWTGKWTNSIVRLPGALTSSLARRTTEFFQERFKDTSNPLYDVEAGNERAVEEVARLRQTSANFDNFIQAHPALKSVVAAHLKEHGHQIVWMNTEEYVPSPTDTVFEKWRKLQDEKVTLEFMWEERMAFVKKHPLVMECMLEHMRQHATKPVQELESVKNEQSSLLRS